MVPYHRPIPEKRSTDNLGGLMSAWIQAEKLAQLAMMLPCAGFIGWLAGYGLDRWLHQAWIAMAGAVFGVIAGLIAVVRIAIAYGSDPARPDENGNQSKTGDSGKTS